MLTLIVFILILSILVLVHELGHFIVAKKSGVRVEEFGLGLPPRLFGKKIGDTIYSLNLLPFGGFVKLTGEDSTEDTNLNSGNDSISFAHKKPSRRLLILLAGVFMNFVLGIFLFYIVLISNGYKSLSIPLFFNYHFKFGTEHATNTVVGGYLDKSAAKDAGIKAGEAVLEVNGVPVYDVLDIRREIKDKVGKPVKLLLLDLRKDASALRTVTALPTADTDGSGILGIYLTKTVVLSYDKPVERLLAGPMHAYNMLAYSAKTFGSLISLSVKERSTAPVSESVAGPIGIYTIVGSILSYGGSREVQSLLDFVALMSISLAFINVMPFPALDGGRILFIIIEILRRGKKINPTLEANVHKWGMMILLGLILLISIKDVAKIFG